MFRSSPVKERPLKKSDEAFGEGLDIKVRTLTKYLETKSKTLDKGLEIETKTLRRGLESNNG